MMVTTDGRHVKCVPAGGVKRYTVMVKRRDGSSNYEAIGTVSYWIRRYNLRRVLVTKGWRAQDLTGARVGYHENNATADTRRGAVEALLRGAGHEDLTSD